MKLEIVVIPVSDVDRAKEFYGRLGWRLDADFASGDDFRVIQFTPPGSGCSVIFGKNVTAAAPGSAQGLYLIVSDIEAARDELLGRGVEISEVFHDAGGVYAGPDEPYLFGRLRVSGPDPEHRSYRSFASFSDPDGNGWLLQEITTRLPGRVDPAATSFGSASDLASALRRAEAAHGEHEKRIGKRRSRTGPTGTPRTWWRSRPGRSCRRERLRRHRRRLARRALHRVRVFPDEIYAAPRSSTEHAYPKLIYYNGLPKGGHFAAWEQWQLFCEEIRAAFRSLR